MFRHFLRQCWLMALTLFGVVTLVFLILRLTPGDPVRLMLGDYATPEAVAELRRQLGLDRSIGEAYLQFVGSYARGDFGTSLMTKRPVLEEVLLRGPYTIHLALAAMLFSALVGLPLGVLAALRRNSAVDLATMGLATVGAATPVFFLGLVLILVFAVRLKLLPAIGAGDATDPFSLLQHLILPAAAVGAATAALVARMTRSSMLEVLGQDYMRTARAKGLHTRVVLWRHGMKNAAIPLATVVALNLGYLVGGAVVTETVFARPGLGKLLVDAIVARDYPTVQGVTFFVAAAFILLNVVLDLVYVWLDPRIRYG